MKQLSNGGNKKKQFLTLEEKIFIIRYKETNTKSSFTDAAKAASAKFGRPFTKQTIAYTFKSGLITKNLSGPITKKHFRTSPKNSTHCKFCTVVVHST